MKAAVVSSFGTPPRYQELALPGATGENDMVVEVIAAGLHPRVRSQADGSHYTSTGELPLVPGIDGVGRGPDGRLRYFVLPDTSLGSMAERTIIDARRSVVLPEQSDPVAVAAAMNPAMSSWVALRRRISFQAGQDVLVLGATGNAGRMAVQVARFFGARRVVAAGRRASQLAQLPRLGATDTVKLADSDRLGQAAGDVDVVIDYVWGEPTAAAMAAVVRQRADREKPLAWIEVGSVAG
ncbi:MAG TPA: zinc-binding alcohol dehydrogenase family protein, partial [Myxococcales bacterium]|nr:zinc-binding alcohol dehydrogenase family protein [Myxococcales bacterium]